MFVAEARFGITEGLRILLDESRHEIRHVTRREWRKDKSLGRNSTCNSSGPPPRSAAPSSRDHDAALLSCPATMALVKNHMGIHHSSEVDTFPHPVGHPLPVRADEEMK